MFGASGYIGTRLTPYLVEHGFKVRAAARNSRPLAARQWPNVELRDAEHLHTVVSAIEAESDVAAVKRHRDPARAGAPGGQ